MACRVLNFTRSSYTTSRRFSESWILSTTRSMCSHKTGGDSPNKEAKKQNKSDAPGKDKKIDGTPIVESDSDKKDVKGKLASLLSEIKIFDSERVKKTTTTLNLAKPSQRLHKKKHAKDQQEKFISFDDPSHIDKKLILAVKDVSSNAANSKEMEAELLNGLSSISGNKEVSHTTKPDVEVESELEKNMMSAVKAVASTVTKDPEYVQSELTKKLLELSFKQESGSMPSEKENMKNLFEGMKVDTTRQSFLVEDQVSHPHTPIFGKSLSRRTHEPVQKIDIFNSPPLDIFHVSAEKREDQTSCSKLLLWHRLKEKELKSLVVFAPANAFEEMIQLTEQGKHWKFPIDNEIDMGEEENVGFHEHVFLEHLLEGFPQKGPIRHFMELVITGLSKNPYITVERKKENIEWFRQYFIEKRDILKDYGM